MIEKSHTTDLSMWSVSLLLAILVVLERADWGAQWWVICQGKAESNCSLRKAQFEHRMQNEMIHNVTFNFRGRYNVGTRVVHTMPTQLSLSALGRPCAGSYWLQ